jgi:hypothetical protein
MTQETLSAEAETQDGQTPASEASQRTDFSTLPGDVQAHIKELQEEAKKYRKQRSEVDKQRQLEEQARLEANKEWEKAADAYKKQVEALSPRAERLDAMEQFLRDSAQKRIDALPKQFRALVPDYDDPLKTLQWLDANAATLSLPAVPNLGAGEQGDRGVKTAELTPEQKAMAKKMKIPEDKYAATLQKERAKQRS